MAVLQEPVKLKRGTATRIARRVNLSVQHVDLVMKRRRAGSPKLLRAILREHERQLKRKQNGQGVVAP